MVSCLSTPFRAILFYIRKGDFMKIFVVGGKSGSGKGEVAKIIKEYYIYKLKNCVITGFTKYLKLFAMEMTDWDGVSANKPRDFLQSFGDQLRAYDEKFLTKRMVEDLNIYEKTVDVVVINDARLPLEIEEIKENFDDCYSIYVVNNFGKSTLTVEQQAHYTETALENYDEFDYIIANDTLPVLKEKVFKILEDLEK